jgi:tryptophanyl-tRNA synthetase
MASSSKSDQMRVLTGLQPSGELHLGNYFGSLKPNLEMIGKAADNFLLIVDLHALTTVQDPEKLREYRKNILLDFLASGFDPEKAVIFYQSDVPQHTELMWLLSVITPMGLLERAVSYKDKVEKGITASVGLFTYPVLMAADILLYGANVVPVGKDQKQHVEIARDIAMKFNNIYGDVFVLPEPVIKEDVAVVPGTDGQKMSKSYGNTIPIFGTEKAIQKAIMGIVTDSKGPADPKVPEECIPYRLHRLFLSEAEAKSLADEYRNGIGYGDAKKKLFQAYLDWFSPLRKRREELVAKPAYLEEVAREGAAKAKVIASATYERAAKAVGLR